MFNMTTDFFFRFCQIYINCSETQNLQNFCFEFQNNLCKSEKKQWLYFGLICDKICWSDKEQPVSVNE